MSDRAPLAESDYPSGELPGRGRSRDGLRIEPPTAATRRRLPELILGILLIAGSALAAVLLAMSGRSRTPVVALGTDVARGEVIEVSDLTTAQVGMDGDVNFIRESDLENVVGWAVRTDLTSGTILTPEMLVEPVAQLGRDEAQVGLTVTISQMPSLRLAVGDRVNIVTRASGTVDDEPVGQATVVDIRQLEGGQADRWYLSLRAPATQANLIAMAFVEDSRAQLVLVGQNDDPGDGG